MSAVEIPIFPLNSVLFPGSPLPLRIFEPRYTDMISQCMKTNTGFGVCLIRDGKEVGLAADFHEVGTLARITDFNMQRDGVLGVVVQGESRFRVQNFDIAKNQLITAEVEYFDNEPTVSVPEEYQHLLEYVEPYEKSGQESLSKLHDNASLLGFRLVELLPLRLSQKQYFLQLHEPLLRLERIEDVMGQLDLEQ
jgi:Lon protease-like protein